MGKGRKVARHADRQRWKICGVSPIRAQAIDLIDPGLLSPRSRPHFFGCRKSADLSAGDAVCTELSHKSVPTRLLYVRGPRRIPPSRAAIVAPSAASSHLPQLASGVGLICSFTPFGAASTAPAPWKLVRVPEGVHRPLPCQPPFGSS